MTEIEYNEEDVIDRNGVSAIIKNEKGEILMQEHSKFGFWTIPIGKVNTNEDLIEGLKEKVFEETNFKVKECKKIKSKTYKYQRNGKKVNVTANVYEIKKLPYLSDSTIIYLGHLGFKREAQL